MYLQIYLCKALATANRYNDKNIKLYSESFFERNINKCEWNKKSNKRISVCWISGLDSYVNDTCSGRRTMTIVMIRFRSCIDFCSASKRNERNKDQLMEKEMYRNSYVRYGINVKILSCIENNSYIYVCE